MIAEPLARNDERFLRAYEYDDGSVLAVDFGPSDDATVDVVDGTVIVVIDGEQVEFELHRPDARAFMKNGVLTIETEETR